MLKRYPVLSSVLLLGGAIGLFFWSRPVSAATVAVPAKYETRSASPDGIGKVWMGREISQVMGHPGIGWLERTDREKEEAPSKAIALLELAPDAVLADIGAGSGYYSFRIARKLPRGKVVAVDIQPEMLDFLKKEEVLGQSEKLFRQISRFDDRETTALVIFDVYVTILRNFELLIVHRFGFSYEDGVPADSTTPHRSPVSFE